MKSSAPGRMEADLLRSGVLWTKLWTRRWTIIEVAQVHAPPPQSIDEARMLEMLNVHAAKTNLSKLLARVAKGEEIVIAKSGTPVAKLVPFVSVAPSRAPR